MNNLALNLNLIRIDAPRSLMISPAQNQHTSITAQSQAIGSIVVQCRFHRRVASDGACDWTSSWVSKFRPWSHWSHGKPLGTSGNPAAAESLAMYCSNFSHNLIELWGCLLKNAKVCIGQDCFPCQSHNRKLNVHSIPWEIQHTGSYGNSQFTR